MLKYQPMLMATAMMSVAFANAQDTKLTIPVTHTQADDGKQMYVMYCASCHGLDGRGKGPTASALKLTPTDLTALSKKNKGIYPAAHVVAVLKFGSQSSSHDAKAMPVWGPALQNIDHSVKDSFDMQTLRIANLVKHIETLQVK